MADKYAAAKATAQAAGQQKANQIAAKQAQQSQTGSAFVSSSGSTVFLSNKDLTTQQQNIAIEQQAEVNRQQEEREAQKQQEIQQQARVPSDVPKEVITGGYPTRKIGGAIVAESLLSTEVREREESKTEVQTQELKSQYADSEFAREYEAKKGLTLEGTRIEATTQTGQIDESALKSFGGDIDAYNKWVGQYNEYIAKADIEQEKKYEENITNLAGGIVTEGRAKGATKIQIYTLEGKPIGALGITGAEEPLKYLLRGGEFQVGYIVPKTPEKRAKAKKERAEFKAFVKGYQKQGATFLIFKEGKLVAETSKEKPFYDIAEATQKYGEISVAPAPPEPRTTIHKLGGSSFLGEFGQTLLETGKEFTQDPIVAIPPSVTGSAYWLVRQERKPPGYGLEFVSDIEIPPEIKKQYAVHYETYTGKQIKRVVTGKPFLLPQTPGEFGSLAADIALIAMPIKVPFVKFTPYSITTKAGPLTVSRHVSIGAGGKVVFIAGKYAGGKLFVGKGKPEFRQLEKMDVSAETRGAEPGRLTREQSMIARADAPYMEEQAIPGYQRIAKKGSAQMEIAVEKEIERQKKVPFEYEKTLPEQPLSSLRAGKETTGVAEAIAVQQKKGRLEAIKGSFIPLMTKELEARKIHDIDIEESIIGSGAKAAKEIIKTPMEEGRALKLEGTNISVEGEPVLNIVKVKGEKTPADIEVFGSAGQEGKVFGKKYVTKKIELKILGSKEKLKAYTAPYQAQAKGISITALQSEKSLGFARNLTPEQVKNILRGAKIARYPAGWRSPKDIGDFYMQTLGAAKIAFKSGMLESAKESGKTARIIKEYFSDLDWKSVIRDYKPRMEIAGKPSVETPSSVYTRAIKTSPASALGASSIITTTAPSPQTKKGFRSATSIRSTRAVTRSPYRSPMKSIYKKSPASPKVYGSTKSPTIRSTKSITSAKQTQKSLGSTGITSTKSPLIISTRSPLSPRSPRSPKSPLSPRSPLSPKSPVPIKPIRIVPIKPIRIVPIKKIRVIRIPWHTTQKKKAEETRGERADFIGNVRQSDIQGVYKRQEIIYGLKRIGRLTREDKRLDRKKYGKDFVKTSGSSLLSKTKQNIITRPKKKGRIRI